MLIQAKAADGTGKHLDVTADRLIGPQKEISAAQGELGIETGIPGKEHDPKQVAAFNQGIRSYNERLENQRTAVLGLQNRQKAV